jgi:hypothetical protein
MNYVSLRCPDGDIELRLNDEGSFSLQKKTWDSKLSKHTDIVTHEGTFIINDEVLTLNMSDNKLQYKRNDTFKLTIGPMSVVLPGWDWIQSEKPSFADSISLVQKESADGFFNAAIQQAKKAKKPSVKKKAWWQFWS